MLVNTIKKRDNASFTSSQADLKKATAFVNMNDRQLRDLAYVSSYDQKEQKKQRNSVRNIFFAIPVVDTLANGMLAKKPVLKRLNADTFLLKGFKRAPLSLKALTMGISASKWGGILLGLGVYNKVKNEVVSKTPALRNFEQNNPGMGFIADIGILLGGYALAAKGLNKLSSKALNMAAEESPKGIAKIIQKTFTSLEKVASWLDKTKLNKKILPSMGIAAKNLAEKAPRLSKTGTFALANVVWVMAGLGILKSMHNEKKNHDKVAATYDQLKDAQLKTAKHLNNILSSDAISV